MERALFREEKGTATQVAGFCPVVEFNKFLKVNLKSFQTGIGISIHKKSVVLVKSEHSKTGLFTIKDYVRKDLPNCDIDSITFCRFLKETYNSFTSKSGSTSVWATLPADEAVVRQLLIPKVPFKEVSNAVYWSFRREMNFDEKECVFDFEINGVVREGKDEKFSVTACLVPKSVVRKHVELFAKAGITLSGLTLSCLSFTNLLKRKMLDSGDKSIASVFVGDDYSCIMINSANGEVFTRYIKVGISNIYEELKTKFHFLSDDEIHEYITVFTKAHSGDSTLKVEDGVLDSIKHSWNRILERIISSFEYYLATFKENGIDKVFISGEIVSHPELINILAEKVGVDLKPINPLELGSCKISNGENGPMLTEAVNLSVSDNSLTTNLLCVYSDKYKDLVGRKHVSSVVVAFTFMIIICVSISIWLQLTSMSKQTQIDTLKSVISSYKVKLNRPVILDMATKVKERQNNLKLYCDKMVPQAVLSHVCDSVPNGISLIEVSVLLVDEIKKRTNNTVIVEGIITEKNRSFDIVLGSLMMNLERSNLLSDVRLTYSEIVPYGDQSVLAFKLKLSIN